MCTPYVKKTESDFYITYCIMVLIIKNTLNIPLIVVVKHFCTYVLNMDIKYAINRNCVLEFGIKQ